MCFKPPAFVQFRFVCSLASRFWPVTASTFQYHQSLPQKGLKARGIIKGLSAGPTVTSRRLKESLATGIKVVCELGHVQPIGSLVRFAGVNVHDVLAVAALHCTTPLELTFALGDAFDAHGVVAPPTAHDLAAIGASGGLVAHPACRAQRTWKKPTGSGYRQHLVPEWAHQSGCCPLRN